MNFLDNMIWNAFEKANQEYNKSEKEFRLELEKAERDILEAARMFRFAKLDLVDAVNNYKRLNPSSVISKEVMEAIKLLK